MNSNRIPEVERLAPPTANEEDVVKNSNEIPGLRGGAKPGEEHLSNVLMSHAGDDSVFNKTEVLAGQWTLRLPFLLLFSSPPNSSSSSFLPLLLLPSFLLLLLTPPLSPPPLQL